MKIKLLSAPITIIVLMFLVCGAKNTYSESKNKDTIVFHVSSEDRAKSIQFDGYVKTRIDEHKFIASKFNITSSGKILYESKGNDHKICEEGDELKITNWKDEDIYFFGFSGNKIYLKTEKLDSNYYREYSMKSIPDINFREIELPIADSKDTWPINLRRLKVVEEKSCRYYKTSKEIDFYSLIYEDNSQVEIGYGERNRKRVRTYELYKKDDAWLNEKIEKEIEYNNKNLVGIAVQYFPDGQEYLGYTGEYPAMVIYKYKDRNCYTVHFYPDGTKKAEVWSKGGIEGPIFFSDECY